MIEVFLYIMVLHFIGDFLLQSDRIATNKSTNNEVLSEHVFIYFGTLLTGGIFAFGLAGALLYASANAILHLGTDYVTSRVAREFYMRGERHNFFVTIGADQLIHTVCLGVTYSWLLVQ